MVRSQAHWVDTESEIMAQIRKKAQKRYAGNYPTDLVVYLQFQALRGWSFQDFDDIAKSVLKGSAFARLWLFDDLSDEGIHCIELP